MRVRAVAVPPPTDQGDLMQSMNRREFVILTGAALCGCAGVNRPAEWTGPTIFDIGMPADFKPGIDARWAQPGGFFVVREGDRLYALSAICTHQACPLTATSKQILCGCHGSKFTRQGEVTNGPATVSLPRFGVSAGPDGRLTVDRTKVFEPARWDEAGAWVAVSG